ncbi:MAG: PEP-CTERM sorting domain-containing protein [Planctomycetota bacterium]
MNITAFGLQRLSPALVATAAAVLGLPSHAALITTSASNSAMAVDAAFVNGITGTGDFLDAPYQEPAAGNQTALNLGRFQGREQRPVFAFQLPAIPVGEELVAADLRFSTVFDRSNPQFGGDLEAIGVRGSGTIQISDYQAAGTLIEDDALFTGIADFSSHTLGGSGEAALLNYLTTNYQAGDFVFLRFTFDAAPPEGDYYALFAHSSSAAPELQLTTEVIPEPASLALVAAGLGLTMTRRGRG